MIAARNTKGFTLVELLVVSGIMAVFFALLVTGMRDNPEGDVRRAAGALSEALMRAQSRAVGTDVGSALFIEPADIGDPLVAIASSTIVEGNSLPPIQGKASLDTYNGSLATLTIGPPSNADSTDLEHGYRIRFARSNLATGTQSMTATPWFRLLSNTTAVFRTEVGQTIGNTIWPVSGSQYDVTIVRYPARGELIVTLPKSAAIDLRFSGIGSDPYDVTSTFGSLLNCGGIAITFNSLGHVEALVRNVYNQSLTPPRPRIEIDPRSELYFLVASRADINAQRALSKPTSLWVVVKPSSGRVTTTANVPQTVNEQWITSSAANERLQLQSALWAARERARASLSRR